MAQKKMPLKPLPDGITLPEVPEGWEWCSSTEQDIVLYMPGGFGTQFVLWANFGPTREDQWADGHVSISPPDTESCAHRVDFNNAEDISAMNDCIHLMTTRVLLGMFDKENGQD